MGSNPAQPGLRRLVAVLSKTGTAWAHGEYRQQGPFLVRSPDVNELVTVVRGKGKKITAVGRGGELADRTVMGGPAVRPFSHGEKVGAAFNDMQAAILQTSVGMARMARCQARRARVQTINASAQRDGNNTVKLWIG